MIIGISGKIGSGKDTVGKIIQYLTIQKEYPNVWSKLSFTFYLCDEHTWTSDWEIKKFASKLKQILSILTGISVEDLEKQEVKDRVLGEEWQLFEVYRAINNIEELFITRTKEADAIAFCKTLASFRYQKTKRTVRWLLQNVGTDAMRNVIHPNVWVNALFADYKIQQGFGYTNDENTECSIIKKGHYPNWIITDCRFPNELIAVKQREGVTIRVSRNVCQKCGEGENLHFNRNNGHTGSLESILCNECNHFTEFSTHESETALDNAEFDYIIENNGTIEELIEKVKVVLIKEKIINQ